MRITLTSSTHAAAVAVAVVLLTSPVHAQTGLYIAPGSGYLTLGGGAQDSNEKGTGFGNVSVLPSDGNPVGDPVMQILPPDISIDGGGGEVEGNNGQGIRSSANTWAYATAPANAHAAAHHGISLSPTSANANALAVAYSSTGAFVATTSAKNDKRLVSAWGGESSLRFPIGWFVDLQLSRGLREPFLGAFNIVQFDIAFGRSAGRYNSYGFAGRSNDGMALVNYASTLADARTAMNNWSGEATLKLKSLHRVSDALVFGYRVDLFGGLSRNAQDLSLPDPESDQTGFTRGLDVETGWAGVAFGTEGSAQILDGTGLFAGASAGAYLAYADGRFTNSTPSLTNIPPLRTVEDDAWRAGVKLSGEVGIRVDGPDAALTTVTFGVDYRTAVARAVVPNETGDSPTHIGWSDVIAYRTGVHMSFRTQ